MFSSPPRLKRWHYVFLVFLLLVSSYFAGPTPPNLEVDNALPRVPAQPAEVEQYLTAKEHAEATKPGNAATIVWANDSLKDRTPISIVYLHGFSASHHEGFPVHRNLGKALGANLLLTRLQSHGLIDQEPFLDFTSASYVKSAQEALALGQALGDRIVLVGTSTGGSLALLLASMYPDLVDAVVLYSPNIEINDPNAWLLNDPWGLDVSKWVFGSDYRIIEADSMYAKYWSTRYRLEALPELQEFLESTMTPEVFQGVTQPVFMGYYYKSETEQDPTVRVDAMLEMFEALGTPPDQKKALAFPEAGAHVLTSDIVSNDWASVEQETLVFLKAHVL